MARASILLLLLAILCLAGLTAGCSSLPRYVADTPDDRFRTACDGFYETVRTLSVQRVLGTISDQTYREIDPYLQIAHEICQSTDPSRQLEALLELERLLTAIARRLPKGHDA